MGKIEQDEILQLAEKSRNAINDVAHLCSGEDEEHIFDMGFYSGYNLAKETYGSKKSDEVEVPKHPSVISENGNELLFDKEGNLIKELPQQETLYTEEQLKLAYMQGYNRGKDGNPNHMESYIEFLKQHKKD
jgi:hypothetical protein